MSNYYISIEPVSPYLMHYRTKGSPNGVRRYQYLDGSLTPLGRVHYGVGPPRGSKVKTDKDSGSKKSGSSSKTTKRRQKAKLITSSGNIKEAIRNFTNLTDKDSGSKGSKKSGSSSKAAKRRRKAKATISSGNVKGVIRNFANFTDKEIQKTRERARLKRDLEREESSKSKPSKGFIFGKNRKEDYSEIIESGNARKIRDNLSKLTDDEIKRGIARAQMNASLKEISNRGGTRLDRVANAAQNIGKIAAAAGTVKSTVDKFTGKGKEKDKKQGNGNGNNQNQNQNGGNSGALSDAIARLQRQLEETENQHRNATANSGRSNNSGNSSRPSQESISEAINRLTEVADTYDRERASARNVTPNGDRGRSSSGPSQEAITSLTRVADRYVSERREREVNEAINNFLRLAEEERRNRRS